MDRNTVMVTVIVLQDKLAGDLDSAFPLPRSKASTGKDNYNNLLDNETERLAPDFLKQPC